VISALGVQVAEAVAQPGPGRGERGVALQRLPVEFNRLLDAGPALLRAAVAGQGGALARSVLVEQALAAGRRAFLVEECRAVRGAASAG